MLFFRRLWKYKSDFGRKFAIFSAFSRYTRVNTKTPHDLHSQFTVLGEIVFTAQPEFPGLISVLKIGGNSH